MSDALPSGLEEWRRRLDGLPPLTKNPRECKRADGTPKHRHATLQSAYRALLAQRAAAGLNPDGSDEHRPLMTYRCSQCGSYHVGRTPKKP